MTINEFCKMYLVSHQAVYAAIHRHEEELKNHISKNSNGVRLLDEKDSRISDLEREISLLRELCSNRESEISELKDKCSEQEEALAAAKNNKGIFGLGKR